MHIRIINGPNLNLLGKRRPEIYGSETFEQTLDNIRKEFPGIDIRYFQSNSEGEIIDLIHGAAAEEALGIVLNPGAYAHYSLAIADALESVDVPAVEVHISNIHAREEFRHKSVTARTACAIIAGCGRMGYSLAIRYLLDINDNQNI